MDLEALYRKQIEFQRIVMAKNDTDVHLRFQLPTDNLKWYQYHILAMVEEMGEIMKADKRWKTHRNERYVYDEKIDEIADVFITAMNIAMFSGVSVNELGNVIYNKVNENMQKVLS